MSTLVIVEETLNVDRLTVWKAITELNQMQKWFFENLPSFKPDVGFETQFNVSSDDRDFMHLWKITEVVLYKKLVCNWKYENIPGNSYVTFELVEEDKNSTKIIVTSEGLESFPIDIPEFTRESCTAGWNYFIKDRLKEYLEKKL